MHLTILIPSAMLHGVYPINPHLLEPPAQGNAVDEKAQPYELRDGLATVRIHGTMLRQVSPRQKAIAAICGVRLCYMEETASALLQAAADPAVHTILMDIDSPGGTVNGTPELAQVVRTIAKDKHVYAFTAGQWCKRVDAHARVFPDSGC